jgi:hypothetical protein
MTSLKRLIAVTLWVLAAGPAWAQSAPKLDVRFCPEAVARPHPLDSVRGVQGLLLQDVAVVNRSPAAIEVTSVEIQLLRAGEPVDRRLFVGAALAPLLRTGPAIKTQGLLRRPAAGGRRLLGRREPRARRSADRFPAGLRLEGRA